MQTLSSRKSGLCACAGLRIGLDRNDQEHVLSVQKTAEQPSARMSVTHFRTLGFLETFYYVLEKKKHFKWIDLEAVLTKRYLRVLLPEGHEKIQKF